MEYEGYEYSVINSRIAIEKIVLKEEESKTKSGLIIPAGTMAKEGSVDGGVLGKYSDHPYKGKVIISSHDKVKPGDIVNITQFVYENNPLTTNIGGKIYDVITQSDILVVATKIQD